MTVEFDRNLHICGNSIVVSGYINRGARMSAHEDVCIPSSIIEVVLTPEAYPEGANSTVYCFCVWIVAYSNLR